MDIHESPIAQVFAIPELFGLILSYLPPSATHYELDGPEADDHRSKCICERSASLASLLLASRVNKHWHSSIHTSRALREALFLQPSQPTGSAHIHPSRITTDAHGRSWTVPATAPWLAIDRAITAFRLGHAPDLPTTNPNAAADDDVPTPPQPYSVNADDEDDDDHQPSLLDLARSLSGEFQTNPRQMYPGRPILNPLLQKRFVEAQFRFHPMHASDTASRYQAYLVVERFDFVRWNAVAGEARRGAKVGRQDPAVAGPEVAAAARKGKDRDSETRLVPSWCYMQLASPPVTSCFVVVWERGPPWNVEVSETATDSTASSSDEDEEEAPLWQGPSAVGSTLQTASGSGRESVAVLQTRETPMQSSSDEDEAESPLWQRRGAGRPTLRVSLDLGRGNNDPGSRYRQGAGNAHRRGDARTTHLGVGSLDLTPADEQPASIYASGRRSAFNNRPMTAVPPSAFYSTKQVRDDGGVTMGMLMAAIGDMFNGDPELRAVKVCTQ